MMKMTTTLIIIVTSIMTVTVITVRIITPMK